MNICAISADQTADALMLAWSLCQSQASASYPLYETRQSLEEAYLESGCVPGGFRLGCFQNNSLCALVFGIVQEDDHYLQTTGFYIPKGNGAMAEVFLNALGTAYPGYIAHIGLPAENTTLSTLFAARHYTLLDNAFDLRLEITKFKPCYNSDLSIQPIDRASLPRYLAFHQKHFDNCYWNAERLGVHAADWQLYGLEREGTFTGGLFSRRYRSDAAEVYGLYAMDETATAALLSYAIQDMAASHTPLRSVLFMADTGDRHAIHAALSLGFHQHSRYLCYFKSL